MYLKEMTGHSLAVRCPPASPTMCVFVLIMDAQLRELDMRIETGMPTEYDREVHWIFSKMEQAKRAERSLVCRMVVGPVLLCAFDSPFSV